MDELIARIEAASGGSRELDWEIHLRDGLDGVGAYGAHPYYTSSIDAALTLVPDGFDWTLGHTNGGLTIHAEVGGRGDEYLRFGATPALALCAAALRARAA